MNQRIERILVKLAQVHAPHLISAGWNTTPDAVKKLARGLAEYDLLVIVAQIPQQLLPDKDRQIQNWANAYARFHNLLAQTLFPNYAALNASYADDQMPPVIVLQAQISPVIDAMAGYLVPFVASRQSYTNTPEADLRVLLDAILERMATDDLSRPIYNMLVSDGIAHVRRLLELPVKHIALTDFDRKLFNDVPKPSSMPTSTQEMQVVQSTPPPAEPEPEYKLEQLDEIDGGGITPTERMFIRPVSLTSERKPPVPDLPRRNDKS